LGLSFSRKRSAGLDTRRQSLGRITKISSLAKCKSACYEITEADILQVLGTADVKFSESNIRDKDVPEYVLEGKGVNGETHKLLFRIEYMSSYLLDILPEDDRKDCNCGN
jgi:hypothetical protein